MSEHLGNPEETTNPEQEHVYLYDAVVVLGGGLYKPESGGFYPTDLRQGDDFGMLGSGMRLAAGTELYLQGKSHNIVFSTGRTDKNRKQYGDDLPTEAQVSADKFGRVLDGLRGREDYKDRFAKLEEPNIILEDKSSSTLTNIQEVLQLIKDRDWHSIAIVSSDYHIPRVQALYERELARFPELKCTIAFIKSEEFMKQAQPGKYDDVIDKYYQTSEAQRRIASEKRGLEVIASGKYATNEFQLEDRSGIQKESTQNNPS